MATTTPRFTAEEEAALHARMMAGDKEAGNQLAESMKYWVHKVAYRANRRYKIPEDELIPVANYGLAKALRGFDPHFGCRLTTYVGQAVVRTIQRWAAEHGPLIHVPANLLTANPSNLSPAERARREKGLAMNRDLMRIDAVPRGTPERQAIDAATIDRSEPHDEKLEREELHAIQVRCYQWALAEVAQRNPRAAEILTMRLLREMTLQEIAELYGITRERVRQIQSRWQPTLFQLTRRAFADPTIMRTGNRYQFREQNNP